MTNYIDRLYYFYIGEYIFVLKKETIKKEEPDLRKCKETFLKA